MFVKLKKISIQGIPDGIEIITDWENGKQHTTFIPKECDNVGLKNALIGLCGRIMNDRDLRNMDTVVEQENNE